jgi:hypothetical protein
MVTPASLFRPHGSSRDDRPPESASTPGLPPAEQLQVGIIEPPPLEPPGGAGVEFDVRVPPSGELTLVPGRQRVSVNQGLAGRTLIVRADLRSIHLLLDGHVLRTVASRLLPPDLAFLAMRGARPAGPAPAAAAIPRLRPRPSRAATECPASWPGRLSKPTARSSGTGT